MNQAERAFVVSSFASNYRHHTGIASDLVYRHCILEPFEEILPRLDVHVLSVPGMPDEFMGWRASRGETLFYLYVKKDYRAEEYGVARQLMPAKVTSLVFETPAIHRLLAERRMYPKARPWAAFDLLALSDTGESP